MEANLGYRQAYKQGGKSEQHEAGAEPDKRELRGDGPVRKPASVYARVKVPGVNQDKRKTL